MTEEPTPDDYEPDALLIMRADDPAATFPASFRERIERGEEPPARIEMERYIAFGGPVSWLMEMRLAAKWATLIDLDKNETVQAAYIAQRGRHWKAFGSAGGEKQVERRQAVAMAIFAAKLVQAGVLPADWSDW